MTSHRRQGGLAPRWRKPGPGRRRPARLIAAGTTVVAMAGTGVAWALMPASPAGGSRSMSMASASRPVAAELMAAIRLADQSGTAKGMLPQADCLPDSMTMVTCMAPAPGITGVVLSTYPSLGALYSAYAAKVKSLNSGAIWQNYQDCGLTSPSAAGEVAWNHQFRHPRGYSIAQMASGQVTSLEAAGRVFCTMTDSAQEDMVWTQDDGRLMGWVAGAPHEDVWNWWMAVHHNLVLGGAGSPARMPMPMPSR
jgi:hypothetical protein